MKAYESGSMSPLMLHFGARWSWVASLTPQSLYPCGKNPLRTMTTMLGGLQRCSGGFGEKKIPFPNRDSIPGSSGPWPRHYINYWPTDNKVNNYSCGEYCYFPLFRLKKYASALKVQTSTSHHARSARTKISVIFKMNKLTIKLPLVLEWNLS
jgi:hypothetical protein